MFGPLITCYMFLGGAAAGCCLVTCTLSLLAPRERIVGRRGRLHAPRSYVRLCAGGLLASIIVLALGCLCLVADLGRPTRVLNLFLHPTASYISLGTFAIAALMLIEGLLALLWCRRLPGGIVVLRVLSVIAMLDSLVVMLYTGLFLMQIQAVPLWSSSALVPVLFVISSCTTGIALTLLTSCITGAVLLFWPAMRRLVRIDLVLMLLEFATMVALLVLAAQDPQGLASVRTMLTGALAPVFWLGVVLVGLMVPLLLELTHARRPATGIMMATSLLVLVGGFAVRLCILGAGVNPLVALAAGVTLGG